MSIISKYRIVFTAEDIKGKEEETTILEFTRTRGLTRREFKDYIFDHLFFMAGLGHYFQKQRVYVFRNDICVMVGGAFTTCEGSDINCDIFVYTGRKHGFYEKRMNIAS